MNEFDYLFISYKVENVSLYVIPFFFVCVFFVSFLLYLTKVISKNVMLYIISALFGFSIIFLSIFFVPTKDEMKKHNKQEKLEKLEKEEAHKVEMDKAFNKMKICLDKTNKM